MSAELQRIPAPWHGLWQQLAALVVAAAFAAAGVAGILFLWSRTPEVTPANLGPRPAVEGPISTRVPLDVGGTPCHQCR